MANDTARAVSELVAGAARFGIRLAPEVTERFRLYLEILLFWRQRLSLTGAATARELALDHVLDSLYVCTQIPSSSRVADLGSGAGFPGLPIAIANPDAAVHLIESRRKRATFLREVVRQTGLLNVIVTEARVEDVADKLFGTIDVATARAFGSTQDFLKLASTILKTGGLAVAMKGPTSRMEDLADRSDFEPARFVDYELPTGRKLVLVICRKS